MGKQMKTRWLWAGALAGTLALGTACSATEAPTQLAQATPSTGQTGTAGSGAGIPGTSTGTTTGTPTGTTTPDTMAPGTSTTAPGAA
ncbi:Erp protein, partial [Pyxidicoccus sp. 3LFB2]